MPDSTLETDDEVRTVIEFMAERGYKDYFCVTCVLMNNVLAGDIDVEPQDDDGGFDTGEEAGGRWGKEFHGTKKKKKGKGDWEGKALDNAWHEGIQLNSEW
jgi:hypothetical protein